MDAKELRVGNIIYKHFEGGDGEIEDVSTRTIFDCQVNPTGKFTYSGVPLSPEIIEKCGFNGKYKSCGYSYQKDGIQISSQDTDDLGNSIKDYVFHVYVDYKYEPIYFLHDLQNRFYSLTKKELVYEKTVLNNSGTTQTVGNYLDYRKNLSGEEP